MLNTFWKPLIDWGSKITREKQKQYYTIANKLQQNDEDKALAWKILEYLKKNCCVNNRFVIACSSNILLNSPFIFSNQELFNAAREKMSLEEQQNYFPPQQLERQDGSEDEY